MGSFNLPHQTGYVITSCISSSVRHAIVPPLFQRFRVTSKNNSNTLRVVCIFSKKEKKLRFQKHPDASVQGLTRKHVGLFAKHATINALSPLTLTFLRTLVSSNEETLPQFEDFFTAASLTLATTTLSISLLVFAKGISIHQSHQKQLLFSAIRQDSPPSKSANTKGPTFE